jgi:hypothetical protein
MKNKFEVGKWYKVNNEYTKFHSLGSEGVFYGVDHIYNDKYRKSIYDSPTYIFRKVDNPILLTDLSEIQQYLPDGHPDKFINKSETSPLPEKWYLEVTKSNLSYVSSKRAWSFDIIGYIHSSLSHNIPNYWFYYYEPLKGYTEITLEQFKEYVVKDVTSKKVKPEIPEYVECIELDSCLVLNKIYKVKSQTTWTPHYKNRCDTVYYLEDSKAVGAYYTSYFEPSNKQAFDAQNKPKEQTIEEILEICKKKYPIGTTFRDGDSEYTVKKELIIQYDSCISHIGIGFVWQDGKYAEIISLPEPVKINNVVMVDDFAVRIGDIDPYQQELERVIWDGNMVSGNHLSSFFNTKSKSNDLEFQYPVINVRNKKKSKLIIINQ